MTLVTKMVHCVAGFYGLVVRMEGIQVLVDVHVFFAFQFTHMKITYQLILGDLKSLACLSSMPRLLSPMTDCEKSVNCGLVAKYATFSKFQFYCS